MVFFGHLGFGSRLARPFRGIMPWAYILVGTLAPDLIDKLIYYSATTLTGLHRAELGILSGTRTFGHTALLWLVLTVIATLLKQPRLGALCLGAATHLLIDNVGDRIQGFQESSAWIALTFPLGGWRFSVIPFESAHAHLSALVRPYNLVTELLGALLLLRDFGPRWLAKWGIRSGAQKPKVDPPSNG